MQLGEIAKNQDISEKYSEQIISHLKSAGLVISQRGSQGGYMLSRSPSDINLREIVETTEGVLSLSDNNTQNGKNENSPTRNVWEMLSKTIADTLEGITLENMVDDYKKINSLQLYEI